MEKIQQFFKKNHTIILVTLIVSIFLLIFLYQPNQTGMAPSNDDQAKVEKAEKPEKPEKPEKKEESPIKKGAYYGVLFLGSDKGAQNTNGGDNTDSITYVAYSPEKKQVFTIPIYRDTLLTLTCGGEKNINNVYREHGATCLIQSVEKLLSMPVDYYIYTTADAFVSITDSVGGIDITAQDTFCSPYSNNGRTYCIEAGKSYTMDGNMLLAYARDRNHGSGVPRANRHQAILSAMTKKCIERFSACTAGVAKEMVKGNIVHNFPIHSITEIQQTILLPKEPLNVTSLDTIKGENYKDGSGIWHMKIDPADIQAKKATIEAAFGERKKES